MPTDLAIFLGDESKHDDWELRYLLRSFWKNFADLGRVWIIGHVPRWLKGGTVEVIHWPDPYKHCKDANLIQKVIRLASEPELSERFILSCDDHVLLKPAHLDDFQPYYVSEMSGDIGHNQGWFARLNRTGKAAEAMGVRRPMHFDGHIPYPIEKSKVANMLAYDYGAGDGYTVFSLYYNANRTEGVRIDSKRIRGAIYQKKINDHTVEWKLANNLFASYNDEALEHIVFKLTIEEMFPEKSPFEK